MNLVYLQNAKPNTGEEKLISSLKGASLRNARKWKGEVESCDGVYTDSEEIAAAYRAKGIPVLPVAPSKTVKPRTRKAKSNG